MQYTLATRQDFHQDYCYAVSQRHVQAACGVVLAGVVKQGGLPDYRVVASVGAGALVYVKGVPPVLLGHGREYSEEICAEYFAGIAHRGFVYFACKGSEELARPVRPAR